jgi:hypothetical protein
VTSPEDYLSVKDFYRVYAYVSLYAAITADADMADMTLTFVANKYPRKLINYFTEIRHYRVEEVESGISRDSPGNKKLRCLRRPLWLKSPLIWLFLSDAKSVYADTPRRFRANLV